MDLDCTFQHNRFKAAILIGIFSVFGCTSGEMSWTPLSTGINSTSSQSLVITSCSPTTGTSAGGFVLVLSGANFSSSSVVNIGNNSCPIVSQSSTSISCIVPSLTAGTYSIMVANSSSSRATLANGLTIGLPPNSFSYTSNMVSYYSKIPITTNTLATTAGNNVTYSLGSGSLDGLSLNSTTGAISGTPYQSTSSTVTIDATNPFGFILGSLTFSVLANWTWLAGSQTTNLPVNFGTQGVASGSNTPGSRYRSMTWVDSSNNLWLFGGVENATTYEVGDVWEFNGTNWIWVGGSNSLTGPAGNWGTMGVTNGYTNIPGERLGGITWVDSTGNFWLYGGSGSAGYGDLWEFSPWTGYFTWMGGSNASYPTPNYGTQGVASGSNTPGSRVFSANWKDAGGNIWLFGGSNGSSTDYADFWEYNGTNWIWMGGTQTINAPGVYGTLGVPGAGQYPTARMQAASWVDSSGNFWLFGGENSSNAALNDLWRWDGTYWTWMAGSSSSGQAGTYGTLGQASAVNTPGARYGASYWTDAQGNFWLLGGYNGTNYWNDLWKFNGTDWIWEGGSNVGSGAATWGTEGTPASTNIPGNRYLGANWTDSNGSFWIYGGYGSSGGLADLWRYNY